MSVQNLSQEQKNYILMLLMGGDLPQNEIRMFLARSGWSIDLIDAGVEYAQDPDLKRTLREARGESVEPIGSSAPVNKEQINNESSVIVNKILDPYRETAELVASDFVTSEFAKKESVVSAVPSSFNSISQLDQADPASQSYVKSTTNTYNANAVTMTMPDIPAVSVSNKILSLIIWLLSVTMILLLVSVVGFMYYTKTGLFGDVIYNKININV